MSNDAAVTENPPPSRRAKHEKQPLSQQEAAAKRAKAEKIGRTVAVFIMPLMIVGMMIWGYLGAMHHQSATNMPVAISATSSAAAGDFARALEAENADAVDLRIVDSAREARELVYDREVTAAVDLDGDAATLYTASSAGMSATSAITAVLTPVIVEQSLELSSQDLAPLPENDSMGMGAMLLATAMITAGYMPWSLAFSNSPELLKRRRALPLLGGWSILLSGLGILVGGPILGVIPAASTLPAWSTLALGVFAVGAGQLLLTRIFGAMAVIPGMLLFMVLGQPASNMGMSVYTLPKIFPFLHQFLPMPALGEAMRSVLYFDGDGAGVHILILAGGAVAALLLVALIDALRIAKGKSDIPTQVNVASLHGGPRPKNKAWRYITLAAVPFGMIAIMLSAMLGAMQTPAPREMPVAVVGSSMEQAQQTVDSLKESMEDQFVFTAMDNADDARYLVESQELTGAFVLPSAHSPEASIYTAQASGNAASQVVVQVFTQIGQSQEMAVDHQELAPLPEHDNMGTVAMYLGMGWVMAGFMVIMVGSTAAPHLRPLQNLIPLVAVYSAFMSAVLYLIAGPFTGAVEGHFWQLFGTGMLAIFSVAMLTTVFNRLMGMVCLIPTMLIVMFLGVPASNGALSIYMEPRIFTILHDVLPMPAAVEAIRAIVYFDGAGVSSHLVVLGIWALACLALTLVIDQLKPVQTSSHPISAEELAALQGRALEAKASEAAASADAIDAEAVDLADAEAGGSAAEDREKDAVSV
ncbi:ABC transporter permease [Glutamicibacter sp.]|uniref:ABC transporter permease n=1 Tax=Glutamicibacter sp. TaxID=1931995 RepID=UPI003D6B99B5